jgi:hypothetical protein
VDDREDLAEGLEAVGVRLVELDQRLLGDLGLLLGGARLRAEFLHRVREVVAALEGDREQRRGAPATTF